MKKLTVIFLCLLLASVTLGCGKKNGIRATYAGNINMERYYHSHEEISPRPWETNDKGTGR